MNTKTKWNLLVVAGFAAVAVATGILPGLHFQRQPSVVQAAPQANGPITPSSMCSATQQPNIGSIANAISNGGKGPFVTDFNVLSTAAWCTFEWLNWPQEKTPKLGDCLNPAGGQTCEVRWEQWLPSTSVYCPQGAAPNPKTGCSAVPKTAVRHLRAGTNPSAGVSADVNTGTIGSTQPTGFALPDKNNTGGNPGNPSTILYESVEEPSLVAFLIKHKLYNLDGQQALYNSLNLKGATAGLPPPAGLPPGQKATPLDFPVTAFELKPSWYVSTTSEVQSYGMINAQGTPPAPVTNCPAGSTCPIGLTGFHILWKVFPKSPWFWATFEFENTSQTPNITNFTIAPMLTTQQPNATLPSNTNVSKGPYVPYDSTADMDPMSVAAAAATAQFKMLFAGTFLANYKLVGVQVSPTMPDGSPSYLANNHLETDFGAIAIGNVSGVPQNVNRSSSCITCHYNASIGSTNTEQCNYVNGQYTPTPKPPKNLPSVAYFRRVPIYLRNQDAKPPFTNQNGLPPCAAYNDANDNPAGYTGPFNPSVYSHQCESKGAFVAADFVWSLQEAQWASKTNGCPATRPVAEQ
jgi:hypothetical protein